jgi:hypothetical protein
MSLRVVGAGLGRTGTHSLKLGLEQLLDAPCYHMLEVFGHPEHVPEWHKAILGEPADWESIFAGYAAAVDWPAGAFYEPLSALYPDAVVVLSLRDSPEAWANSFCSTIQPAISRVASSAQDGTPLDRMVVDLLTKRFTPDWQDRDAAMAAYERHNDSVRANVPAARLVEWRPADGWGPLCDALGLPQPAEPFPHVNTTDEFRAMTGLTPQ